MRGHFELCNKCKQLTFASAALKNHGDGVTVLHVQLLAQGELMVKNPSSHWHLCMLQPSKGYFYVVFYDLLKKEVLCYLKVPAFTVLCEELIV